MYGTSPLQHGEPVSPLSGSASGDTSLDANAGTLPPGTHVGDLRIERVLGRGGYGVVYLAHDQALNRRVALKEFWPQALAQRVDETQLVLRTPSDAQGFRIGLEAFLDEARLLARFDHPSLVRVHRFWEQHGTAYMSMSWVEGRTLQALRQTMSRPPDEAWLRERLLLPLLDVLEMMHAASCLHRDISPTNILMEAELRPVLLDLGAARRVHTDMTQPLTAVLNPAFAPLEQFAESADVRQGPWTDVYSLAAVVFYAITGAAPTAAPLRAVHPSPPAGDLLRQLASRYPGLHYSDAFLNALDAAFEVVPTQRLASARAWRDALLAAPAPVVAAEPAMPAPPPAPAPAPAPATSSVPVNDTAGADAEAEGEGEPTEDEIRRAIHAAVHTLQFTDPAPKAQAAQPSTDRSAAQRREPSMGAWHAGLPERSDERRAPAAPRRRPLRALFVAGVLGAVALGAWQVYERMQNERRANALAAASPDLSPSPAAAPREPAPPPQPEPAAAPPVTAQAAAAGPVEPVADAPAAPQARTPAPAEPAAAPAAEPPAPEPPAEAPPEPAAAAPAPAPPARQTAAAPRLPASPREACGARTNFSLYYCMQTQCRLARYTAHAQCELLRERDIVFE